MTRIEDALHKLQARHASQSPDTNETPRRLAAVVPSEHSYLGKRVDVDVLELAAQGLLAPDSAQHLIAEQYRAIKRPLLRNADLRHEPAVDRGNVIMVASALSGEGKTFTCLNLCLSIARERDWQVVLVDADCSKPHLTRLFSAENEPGLIDLLRDSSIAFESVVMSTNIPGFSIVPAGARDDHSSELLASSRMDSLCQSLSRDGAQRVVVFDSSPLLLTTQAEALAQYVGQIVVVVRANETPQPAVLSALEKLNSQKAISCILNQSYDTGTGLGYGYGYGDYPSTRRDGT